MLRPLLAAALAAAALGATAADAACVGTQQLGRVCVTVDRGALPKVTPGESYATCVDIAGLCVVWISVPEPYVQPGNGGSPVVITCGGSSTCG